MGVSTHTAAVKDVVDTQYLHWLVQRWHTSQVVLPRNRNHGLLEGIAKQRCGPEVGWLDAV